MSKHGGVRTIRLPLRKIGAAIPAVALIGGGIIFSASAAPAADPHARPVALSTPAIVIPDIALTLPGSAGPAPAHAPRTLLPGAPASRPLVPLVPAGTAAGSSTLVTLDSPGIPVRALEGYRGAVTLIASADPSCKLDWALLAAIGRVESNHARFGGNQLDSAGIARPGIIGMALNGSNGTALITDTDGGLLDRDTTYDRAVGPMQFIPSTWRFAGVDADGDGVKNPQDMADSAAATGRYLCSGPGDLTRPSDLRSAILRYNASDSYVSVVTSIANAYRHGVNALPAVDLAPVVETSTVASRTARPATRAAGPGPSGTAYPTTRAPATKPAVAPRAPVPTSSTPASTQVPQPATTTSAPPATSPTSTPSTSTTSTSTTPVCVPATTTTSTAPPSGDSSPTATETCVPDPCPAPPAPTTSTSTTSTASPSTPATSGACATATATASATSLPTSTSTLAF